MKKTLFSLFIGASSLINAQLSVGNNSYVMVSNAYLYSTTYLNNGGDPASGSNVYLRRDGQFFQNGDTTVNSGAGNLSVYQEGTSSHWQHNAWCSPVGNPTSTGNQPFGITLLKRPTSISGFGAITPIATYNGSTTNTDLNISKRWIYTYNNSSTYAGWSYIADATTIAAGLGFSMKGSSGTDTTLPFTGIATNNPSNAQRYEFRGRPNSGTIARAIAASPAGEPNWIAGTILPIRTLVGNPYPSAIDLATFLSDNSTVLNGAIYYWEQANVASHNLSQYQGGYGVWVPAGGSAVASLVGTTGVYTPPAFYTYASDGTYLGTSGTGGTANIERRFAPVGQGFMVQSNTTGGSFEFRNSQRVFRKEGSSFNSEFRSNNANNCNEYFEAIPNMAGYDYTTVRKSGPPQIKIYAVVNNGGVLPTTLAFDREATDNYDYGYDATTINATTTGFYYKLPNRPGEEFVISTTNFDLEKRVPVVLRCGATTNFKINVPETLNCFDSRIPIYIYDAEADSYHDIRNARFEVDLKPGVYDKRFFVTFTADENPTNGGNDMASLMRNLMLVQNNDIAKLKIVNPDNQNIKEFLMYDTSGKLLIHERDLGTASEHFFDTHIYPEGVYLTKTILLDNTFKNDKIIINN